MLLKQLVKGLRYRLVQGSLNTDVCDIFYDSRKVCPGGLFVCIVGTQRDSHDFAADVAARGAAVRATRRRREGLRCFPVMNGTVLGRRAW